VIEVLQFTAPWCGPCKPVEALLAELAPRYPGVRFSKVDVDAEPETGMRFGVLALPTVVILRDDEAVVVLDGARKRADYERALAEVVPPAGDQSADA
jgi:thioredoxin 1